jgi:hypothetical protein
MKPVQAKEIIRGKVEMLVELAEAINGQFDVEAIVRFRNEFRTVRSFMTFMRLQRNDKNIKLPENCKYLYHLAGKIKDIITEIGIENPGSVDVEISEDLAKVKKDWKKNYSKQVFLKLGSKISGLDFGKLNPDLLDNFFNNIGKESSADEEEHD